MSRAKTFKKSLRESFRRLRKGRHAGGAAAAGDTAPKKSSPRRSKPESPKKEEGAAGTPSIEVQPGEEANTGEAAAAVGASTSGAAAEAPATVETIDTGDTSTKPVEREITARSEKSTASEEMTSMVRSIHFADTFVMHCE